MLSLMKAVYIKELSYNDYYKFIIYCWNNIYNIIDTYNSDNLEDYATEINSRILRKIREFDLPVFIKYNVDTNFLENGTIKYYPSIHTNPNFYVRDLDKRISYNYFGIGTKEKDIPLSLDNINMRIDIYQKQQTFITFLFTSKKIDMLKNLYPINNISAFSF